MTVKALVIDDSVIMRKKIIHTLQRADLAEFAFTEARDGTDALGILAREEVDIIFLDWNMPKMTGIEFIRELRKVNNRVPIVMITIESSAKKRAEAESTGNIAGYVIKPFTHDQLIETVKPIIAKLAA